MGAKVDVAVTNELNRLHRLIEKQDKEIGQLHEQIKKGSSEKILELEKQVKDLQKMGDEVKAMLTSHHTMMKGHDEKIAKLRKMQK